MADARYSCLDGAHVINYILQKRSRDLGRRLEELTRRAEDESWNICYCCTRERVSMKAAARTKTERQLLDGEELIVCGADVASEAEPQTSLSMCFGVVSC